MTVCNDHLWAVVLAGGDGTRVATLTQGPSGEAVPKQYCAFGAGDSLLRQAVNRAASCVPLSRILVVVAAHHERFWRVALADLPRENVIVQPRNRGTAPGLLLPVLDVVLHRDGDARVIILPADHQVGSEAVVARALLDAASAVRRKNAPVVLLGMLMQDDDHGDYGWILPHARPKPGRLMGVRAFVEKPGPEASRALAAAGALVNSFILASPARRLLRLYEDALPELLLAFVPVVAARRPVGKLGELYETIPSSDFSRDILEACPGSLATLAVPPCGWSDLGTPTRLQRFLSSSAALQAPPREPARCEAVAS
ncbi:MAG: sugar phosphate nucleotidyltransferase [Acidobacteriota bacterium]